MTARKPLSVGRRPGRARGAPTGVPALKDAMPVMAMELARARRYSRPLSFLSAPEPALDPSTLPLRVTDVMARTSDGLLVALLIETDDSDVEALAERIRRTAGDHEVRTASFPKDALTLDELLARVT